MDPVRVKPDLTTQTRDTIRSAILSGELAPCAPLAQEDLAAQLGVSRQPISHALVLLRQEGLVVDRGRKGQMVAPIDPDRLLGLYQVRGALDGLAARLAADRAVGDAKAEKQLNSILAAGSDAHTQGDIDALVETDLAFHDLLYELSGNPEIAAAANSAWPHMVRAMRAVLEERGARQPIWDEHGAIARAVLDGDGDRAGRLATKHTNTAAITTHDRLVA